MNPRYIYSGLIGAVVGGFGVFLIMDRIHAMEINEIYAEMNEMQELMDEAGIALTVATEVMDGIAVDADTDEDDLEVIVVEALRAAPSLVREARQTIDYEAISSDENQAGGIAGGDDEKDVNLAERIAAYVDGNEETSSTEDPEEDEDVRTNIFSGIYIIPNDQVSERMITGTYDHNDGSFEIDRSLSVGDAKTFDDIIENDALFSLLGEEPFDILMESTEPADIDKLNIIVVRNNVINLDFVIRY
jgi:hypothetical protein